MKRELPSILVAGVSSGCGKTLVTLGLMAAFRQMGVKVQPFKCGPDFIDPTLHSMVTGATSWNLDVKMCGPDYVRSLFFHEALAGGINIIEGVMGLFDGGEASAAALSGLLSVPVILVVDASSAAESVAAVVKGFESMSRSTGGIQGVILNRIASPRHLRLIRDAVERNCLARLAGYLPKDTAMEIPSRHLGLFMGGEKPLGMDISRLASTVRRHVNMEVIMDISRGCMGPATRTPAFTEASGIDGRKGPVDIGIARDRAFCFYYPDNLKILECAGARLVPFSPSEDKGLPGGIGGLYLGGGYPELLAGTLSENRGMREDIRDFSRKGMPILAECGGFMYLCRSITTMEGKRFDMAGVFPADAVMQRRLSSLGYTKAVIKRRCCLGSPGDELMGHEFHYSITRFSGPVEHAYSLENGGKEGFLKDNTLAGYIHLHFGRTQEAASSFVQACRSAGQWRRRDGG